MGVAAILHTGLTVSDLDRSVAFYRDLLGLELITHGRNAGAKGAAPELMLGGFRLVDSTR
jgi:catechol 2,3-dioxygenase-like lactoylglutathione lyase family enzyme